ncbi:phosphatase PAP2 family protein [Pleurocapsa sp. PCC 7319]|uniref:phosphatase PAP2 family protein n=1 Tax=Pleurocapsa sp. PCC 7319 TaxID=118161 RepID=UPI0004783973
MLQRLVKFWQNNIHSRIAFLITTVGTVGLVSCLIIIYVVAQISDEVLDQEAFAFDKTILLWIHSFANPTLDGIMHFITRLNDPSTVTVIAFVTLGILLWRRYYSEAQIFIIDCLGGVVLSYGLKSVFGKVRPDLWQSAIEDLSYSYPSGHALGSTVLYGFIAYLIATRYPQFSLLIYAVVVCLIGAIGLSRLYLGVHWPTDIIGGYGIGFLWLTFCITMLKLQRIKRLKISE